MKLLVFAAPLLYATASLAQTVGPLYPLFPPSLKDYLQLTDAQVGTVVGLDAAYDQFSAGKQARIAQLRASIGDLTNADTLDPAALGNAYAEIEAINRDLRDKANQLRSDLAKALTPAQATRLKSLADAQGLLPLASTAECANFLAPLPSAVGSILAINGSLGSFLTASVGAAFTPGVVCGGSYSVSSSGTPVPAFPNDLTAYLGLSVDQLKSAVSLEAGYLQFTLDKQARIGQVQQTIAGLTVADPLDPLALGSAYAEIEAINRDLRAKRADLQTALNQLLTAPQAAKLKVLNDARNLQSVINAAVCESLLLAPPTAAFRTGDFSQVVVANPVVPNPPVPTPVPPARYCGM